MIISRKTDLLKLFLAIVTSLMIASCSSKQNINYQPQSLEIDLSQSLSGSSSDYLKMAEGSDSPLKENYLLAAVAKLIDEHALERARQILNNVSDNTLNDALSNRKKLLTAHLDLMTDNPNKGLTSLAKIQVYDLSHHELIQFHRLLAHAYEQTNHFIQAVEQRIKLNTLLKNEKSIASNRKHLWQVLLQIHAQELQVLKIETSDNLLLGWIDFALLAQSAKTPEALLNGFEQWHASYPDHPAEALFEKNEQTLNKTKKIALFLPFSGLLKEPAEAIREGLMSARFARKRHVDIRFYDTEKNHVSTLYEQAIHDGAKLIIGPLKKDNVRTLMNHYDGQIPVLTLNYSDTDQKHHGLYEFGLSPIDEVQQVAARAWENGYRRVLMIAPEDNWGEFISKHFEGIWEEFGGTILSQWHFKKEEKSYATAIQQLLHIDRSYNRTQQIKQILQYPKLKTIPRRRQDIDMIFILAYPKEIRQIVPLIRFYYGHDIDIMSISMAYEPGAPMRINRDLDRITFCDMPWIFQQDQTDYYSFSKNWPDEYNQYTRLFALGYDAFDLAQVMPRFSLLPSYAMNGQTGYLRLDDSQHIRRKLQWAKVIHGQAKRL